MNRDATLRSLGIVYFSATGTTGELARSVAEGAGTMPSTDIRLYPIEGSDIIEGRYRRSSLYQELDEMDAILFGVPTYMGGPAAQFKAFADGISGPRYTEQRWAGKLAGGMTIGGCANGDQSMTLGYLSVMASQLGMMWVNLDVASGHNPAGLNRLGNHLGLTAQPEADGVNPADLATAFYFGQRLAHTMQRVTPRSPVA